MSILVENISKIYGTQHALNDISFEVKSGEVVGFIGPNGAGKSTTMKIICGYIPQSSGNVWVNGINVLEKPLEVRRNLGYLPENNPLYMDMYVKEYLTFVGGIHKINNKQNRIREIIEQTGLGVEQHKKIAMLSKGYKQRVGIAQALIHNPSVLILDEPTSGLDPNQILEIRNLISEAGKSKTVILSTHIMQEVEAICNRIIIINKGEIVANDITSNIIASGREASSTVEVEFDKAIELEKLGRIPGVTMAKPLKGYIYLLQSKAEEDIRASVFTFAVDNGLTVLSLHKLEKSLEVVFHELTSEIKE